MIFLLDHDVPDDIIYSLNQLRHKAIRLREVLPLKTLDSQVLEYARENECVLITCNRDDFLEIAGKKPHQGIIMLIRRKTRVAERVALIRLLDSVGKQGLLNNINFA